MSEFLPETVTPCPRRLKSLRLGDRDSDVNNSLTSIWEDTLGDCEDTNNIDFTTQVRAPVLTGAKPRRRTKTSTSFAIHTDREERRAETERTKTDIVQKRDIKPTVSSSNRKTSLLTQPAQRFRPRVSFAPSPPKHSRLKGGVESQKPVTKSGLERNNELLRQINGNNDGGIRSKSVPKRDVDRNTVYLPPDDTTVASVFMGLFSPLKSNNLGHKNAEPMEIAVERKRQVKQPLAPVTQRAPLQPSLKVTQESCNMIDIVGKNGGKENIPPGSILDNINKKYTDLAKAKNVLDEKPDRSKLNASQTRGMRALVNEVVNPLETKTANGPLPRKLSERQSNPKFSSPKCSPLDGMTSTLDPGHGTSQNIQLNMSKSSKNSRVGLRTSMSRNKMGNLNSEYPLISENITNPTMYDDNWLSHQEVILTQLINGLFGQTKDNENFDDPTILRQEFLTLYQSAFFTNLYQRLQASLLYGALSIPKDALVRNSRLTQDLGMKQKFVDFWLQTYDPRALRAALETITGRRIPDHKVNPNDSQSSISKTSQGKGKSFRRRLELFLDAFLVQNQDMDRYDKNPKTLGKPYYRTVLRSIMMVVLLDKAKLCQRKVFPGCLFIASSSYKSSVAALQALARILIPSCGDMAKALGQLDCQLLYKQHALIEYEYEITNLAVDMRDGVRLARIVDLLLYPGKISGASFEDDQWQLSRRLKFPCMSRTVKLYNVRIALNKLAVASGAKPLVSHFRAEDLVDGHREKTIALLWGLVNKWGLAELIDIDDLKEEIVRLKEKMVARVGYESMNDRVGNLGVPSNWGQGDVPTLLLTQWASLLTQLRGLRMDNLTACFSDVRIYESIVEEYEGYIIGTNPDQLSGDSKQPLPDRLRALGCNAPFVNLIYPSASQVHFLDNDYTIGILAFLCSRLLYATKRVRAATVLQNEWRRVLAHRDRQKRVAAREIARQCAAVVQTRDQVLWAKGAIVQWWRNVKARQRRKKAALGRKSSRVPLRRYRK